MKTLVLDKMPKTFWQEVNQKFPGYFTTEKNDPYNIEIILLRTKTLLFAENLLLYPNLKLIIRAGSGFDNIDVTAALKRKIAVCTTPDANAQSAFEHTISIILAMIKQLQQGKSNILSGNWKSDLESNWEIADLKVLVVGVGRIGGKVGRFLQSAGAAVRGFDPYLSDQNWAENEIVPIDYETGLSWCNLITYHCPLYKQTANYFSRKVLKMVSGKFWLVNTARGGLVDEDAVMAGLISGKILGFGTDVFRKEPPQYKEFYNRNNVFLTPHIGAYTDNAKNRLVRETIEVWRKFVFEKKVVNEIDKNFI